MVWKDSHPPITKRIEDRARQPIRTEMTFHLGVGQKLNSATNPQGGKALCADASRLSFVDHGGARMLQRVSYGRGLAVIECLGSWANNKALKTLTGPAAKGDDFNKAGSHELVKTVRILPAAGSAVLQFIGYDIYDDESTWQGTDYCRCQSGSNQIDHCARVDH